MQKSENRTKGKKVIRSVWRDFDASKDAYVGRCGKCGKYQRKPGFLKIHWFFNGVYCVGCIQDILYDNARTLEEIK